LRPGPATAGPGRFVYAGVGARYASAVPAGACRNCGETLSGRYCATCGQAVEDGEATSIAHLVQEVVHEVSNVDGKVVRTVVALFTRPGRLTAEYWAGHRVSWIRPLKIFLLAAALHFVTVPGIGPMNLEILLQRTPTGSLDISVGTAARRRAGQGGLVAVTDAEQAAYVERMRDAYGAARYVAPLVFAVGAWLIYRRRQPFLANHVVMAAHFYAFWYLVAVGAGQIPDPTMGGLVAVGLSAAHLVLMLGRLFGEGRWPTLWKAAALYLTMFLVEMGLAFGAALWVARAVR